MKAMLLFSTSRMIVMRPSYFLQPQDGKQEDEKRNRLRLVPRISIQ